MHTYKLFTWAVSFWLLVTMYCCSFSPKASRRLLKQAQQTPYDIVVVPGVPFENGMWSKTMKARVYWAKYLYDKGIAKNIMFSGSAVYSPYYEAKIMALYAEGIGIPKKHIFIETKAEHSTENIYYSYKKAINLGFSRIGLASDPFQTKMLKKFSRKKINYPIGLLPMVIDTLKIMEPSMTDPAIDAQQTFVNDFIPLTKRQGFWKRFRGTMGKNIDTSAYQ